MSKLNTTLEEYNKKHGTSYRYGNYSFSLPEGKKDIAIAERRKQFNGSLLGDAVTYTNDLFGKPVYTPKKVFVVTNQQTFSAAFHYAFYLWKMGAAVVGVPSRQAPNTYMENTPFQLPLTSLKGSISNSFQAFLPADDKRAKVFYPDIMLSRKDYEKYKLDKHSALLYLLDLLSLEQ
jgi:hypothetical protein